MLIYEITDAANSPYALRLNVIVLLGSNHREASKIRHYGGARLSRGHIIRWKLPNCNLVVRSLRCYMSIVYPESQKTVPLLCLRYLWFLSLPSASRYWTSWLCQYSWCPFLRHSVSRTTHLSLNLTMQPTTISSSVSSQTSKSVSWGHDVIFRLSCSPR